MSAQNDGVVLEARKKPLDRNGSTYVCIDKEFLRNEGIDPDKGEVPEELVTHYHKGGRRDGEMVVRFGDE